MLFDARRGVGGGECTCIVASRLGFLGISILRRPIPIAPDETIMTLCPSRRNRTEVSTISDKFERSGS